MNYNKIFLEAWVVCLATNDYILVWIQKILKEILPLRDMGNSTNLITQMSTNS